MIKIIGPILPLLLAGCVTTTSVPIETKKLTITEIPASYFNCEKPVLPKASTLTNKQIVNLLFKYEKEIGKCKVNLETIRKYIDELKIELNKIEGK
jgi:hypothetical protein